MLEGELGAKFRGFAIFSEDFVPYVAYARLAQRAIVKVLLATWHLVRGDRECRASYSKHAVDLVALSGPELGLAMFVTAVFL